ncbi:MAG TPA: rhomboid family intramembrane serine protease [Sandaracinaceae bacterium LLY-WYZ-13_1]|nr:rhomboid family intramembrane serine protease [Sandaracinaceae bacterium LLY-WYZ-13_1]
MIELPGLDDLLGGNLSITFLLMAICVAVSLVGFWALGRDRYRRYFVFRPSKAAKDRSWVGAVLSHFAHGDVGHLLVNLFALFVFGPRVERTLGPLPYLALYAASGIAGTLLVHLFRRNRPRHAALGASGSIAGVVFASIVLSPGSRLMLLVFPFPIPAPVFAVLYLVVSSLSMGSRDGVAHEAHIGGAIVGFGLAGLLSAQGFAPLLGEVGRLVG